jgi:hypothetical protein
MSLYLKLILAVVITLLSFNVLASSTPAAGGETRRPPNCEEINGDETTPVAVEPAPVAPPAPSTRVSGDDSVPPPPEQSE